MVECVIANTTTMVVGRTTAAPHEQTDRPLPGRKVEGADGGSGAAKGAKDRAALGREEAAKGAKDRHGAELLTGWLRSQPALRGKVLAKDRRKRARLSPLLV